jgi:UDP-N-acetylglucosamine diphosphorylase / glucose-1-phosphate thymidylyltransferase / UDP-N-acetylgalactosamine diphosphorylase / glucosamine-1-phosphate N-acetyltransferase / galactosamine-1-phosphate N-acetyltransferase
MPVCVFEDRGVFNLEPLTLARPAFDLVCGTSSLLGKQMRAFGASEAGAVVRPMLAEISRAQHPDLAINDNDWLRRKPRVFVNARWLPALEPLTDVSTPRVGCIGDEVAYAIVAAAGAGDLAFDRIDAALSHWKHSWPRCQAGGVLFGYPWELVDHNPQALADDFSSRRQDNKADTGVELIGPRDKLVVDPSADIEPFVVADTRKGPVVIDRNVIVHSFSRLEGPCYIGAESWLLGVKLRGGTIGPRCRIGGEVEASIVHGSSNKYHDGFLGHSYVGEWVNLAAGTQTSDLRNDYGPIRVSINGIRVPTGRNKVGSFIGDHTKTGLNTLLNCGSAIGAFSNVLPTGSYLPTTIPSFCMCNGAMSELWDLRQLFQTASLAMGRRGIELTDVHTNLFFALYEATAELRRRTIRDHEQRRLRKSV